MLREPSLIPLSHQHHNGLALCVLVRRSLAKNAQAEEVNKLAKRVVDRFELEMVNHFELEERVLFPAVREHIGPLPLVDQLIGEHREIERIVHGLRSEATPTALEGFCALLTRHIRTEENDLFQIIQNGLPREALDSLGKVFDEQAVRICL
jgi:hemerythrin-like domain-containing protein